MSLRRDNLQTILYSVTFSRRISILDVCILDLTYFHQHKFLGLLWVFRKTSCSAVKAFQSIPQLMARATPYTLIEPETVFKSLGLMISVPGFSLRAYVPFHSQQNG